VEPEVDVDVAHRTDPGKEPSKQINEDAVGERKTAFGRLVVVCDGMGGHSGGREASQAALAAIFRTFDSAELDRTARDVMRLAIEHANEMVYKLAPETSGADAYARPGSTVVAVLFHPWGAEIGHVGDSRCYRARGHAIEPLTKDHSLVQEMVDQGRLTPEQAKVHPDANRITRALGTRMDVAVELTSADYAAGDVFVLCSDGLSDVVDPDEILRIVTGGSAEQAAGQLVDLANARGGPDNVSVLVARTRTNAAHRAVAKTMPDHPAGAPAPTTVVVGPKTVPQAPVEVSSRPEGVAAAASTPELNRYGEEELPPSVDPQVPRRGPSFGVILAVAVVLVGLAIGIFAIYKYQTTPKHVTPVLVVHDAGAATTSAPAATLRAPEDDDVEPLRPLTDGGSE
jgi:protein phosphatase